MSELLPLRRGAGSVGFIDHDGRWVIEPRFDFAARFSEGRSLVRMAGRYGFVDAHGELQVPADLNGANWFSCGFACGSRAGVHRFIDPVGAVLDAPVLDAPASFRENLAVIRIEDVSRVIRTDGTFANARELEFGRPFSQGLSAAFDEDQWQYVDAAGETVLRVAGVAESFSEGLAPVKLAKGWSYLNRTGATIIPGPFTTAMPFSDGRALVQRQGRFGFVDVSGREVVPCRYSSAERFASGRAWVRESAKTNPTAIDIDGAVHCTAPDGFELLAPFLNGVALIAKSNASTREYLEHYVFADGRMLQVD